MEAVRSHMRDASHRRVNFERDEIALELSAGAFNFSSSLVAADTKEKGAGNAGEVRPFSPLLVELTT